MLLEKTVYDKLVAKVNNIDTSGFVLKTSYSVDKTELEKKIPNVTDFVKKPKLTEIENKIPNIRNLATKSAITAVENKITSVSNLVNKTNYKTKITEIEKKLTGFNTLASDIFNARLAQANLITKAGIDAELSSLNKKIAKNKTKHVLAENELNKLKTFDLGFFIGKSHFEQDNTQII